MSERGRDLWSLVLDQPEVDPGELATALEGEARQSALDFRTRVLIRDSIDALRSHWGENRLEEWLGRSPLRSRIRGICAEELGRVGFPFLKEQVVEPTRPETIRQLIEELGRSTHKSARMVIGGSGALILSGHLLRRTQDIDVVDEVPAELRGQHALMHDLTKRYRVQLTHFQSHYLPKGWENRVHSIGVFGKLQVSYVDVHDIFMSKLFSHRPKDRDDLRYLIPQLDKETLVQRLRDTTQAWLVDPKLRELAVANWQILYGEELPA